MKPQQTATIATNLCLQILEFQNSIASREEGQRFPTPQEVNLQCKLINTLDKLTKQHGKAQAFRIISGFLSFLGDEDPDLAEAMWERYDQYLEAQEMPVEQPQARAATTTSAADPDIAGQRAGQVIAGNGAPSIYPISPNGNRLMQSPNPASRSRANVSDPSPFNKEDFYHYKV